MTRRFALLDIATTVVVAATLAGALWIYFNGPQVPLPMHFDAHGQPDRWSDRRELAWLVGFLAVVVAATAGGMGLYAARAPDQARRRGLRTGQFLSLLVLGSLAPFLVWMVLLAAGYPTGEAFAGPMLPMALIGLVCLVTGALLGRVPPNVAVGVRTPWSLKSRLAWDRSNRLAGRLMFWIGLVSLVTAPVSPQPIGFWTSLGALMLMTIVSVFESWRVWRTDPDRQPF